MEAPRKKKKVDSRSFLYLGPRGKEAEIRAFITHTEKGLFYDTETTHQAAEENFLLLFLVVGFLYLPIWGPEWPKLP